jgi:hypothetical protein
MGGKYGRENMIRSIFPFEGWKEVYEGKSMLEA